MEYSGELSWRIGHTEEQMLLKVFYWQESGFSYNPLAAPSEIDHDVLYREGLNHNVSFCYFFHL